MSNKGESELNKNIEEFLAEQEVKWDLAENLPKRLSDMGMPLKGQSVRLIPDKTGNKYSLILFTIPGNGCELCGINEPGIVEPQSICSRHWQEQFGPPFSSETLRLCLNCHSLLRNRLFERLDSIQNALDLAGLLFVYSYERTTKTLEKKISE